MGSTFWALHYRELGAVPPGVIRNRVTNERTESIKLSDREEIKSPHNGMVNSLALDHVECRFMLSCAGDCSVALFDTEEPREIDDVSHRSILRPYFVIDRDVRGNHRYSVSSVEWYPFDTGLFVTASMDEMVKVWDTNTVTVPCQFSLKAKVWSLAMSKEATSHCLVAVGSDHSAVHLCDVTSNSFAHTLAGHTAPVYCVSWSPSNEFVLATGSGDKTIRMWDIRKPGCMLLFDQHNESLFKDQDQFSRMEKARTNALSTITSHNGLINGLQFAENGMYLVSTGRDNRARLWDSLTGKNTLVNYPMIKNKYNKNIQIAVSSDSRYMYHPRGISLGVYGLQTGELVKTMKGHFKDINCCLAHPTKEVVYTGAADRQILCYSVPEKEVVEDGAGKAGNFGRNHSASAQVDEDEWSDSD